MANLNQSQTSQSVKANHSAPHLGAWGQAALSQWEASERLHDFPTKDDLIEFLSEREKQARQLYANLISERKMDPSAAEEIAKNEYLNPDPQDYH